MNKYTPKTPFLLRAFHEWLEENMLTPYLIVDAAHKKLHAPTEYAQNGQLVLCISYEATKDLLIDNDYISFSARFGGISQEVWVPMGAVLGLIAKEDHAQAMAFNPGEYLHDAQLDNMPAQTAPAPKIDHKKDDGSDASFLKIIK